MSSPQTTARPDERSAPASVVAAAAAAAEWDLAADTVSWSPAAFRMLGRDPRLGPLTLDQLPSQLVPQDRPALRRMVTEALVHGRPLDGVIRVGGPLGSVAAVHCTGRPVLGPDGHVVSLRMLLQDA